MADQITAELLQQQQIPDLPSKMFYIPNFITADEEQRILEKVNFDAIIATFPICSV
jgi:hypothetical protein